MRTATLLISLLLIQTGSTTFKEGIDRVMADVETSFSKLFSEVITDMKVVIDCTILEVEHALSLGLSDSTLEYQRKCLDGGADDEGEAKQIEIQSEDNFSNEIALKIEQTENQLSSAITDMNKTFHNVINSNDLYSKLDHIRLVLKNETDHLASVSTFFKSRMEKISDKIKQHSDQKHDSISDIFTHLKMLHETEKTEHNANEIHEIHDVINEIIKILQLDENKLKAVDDEDKIQVIIDALSQNAKANETAHQKGDGCDNSTEVSNNKETTTNVKEIKTIITGTTNTAASDEAIQPTRAVKKGPIKEKESYEDPFDLSSLLGLDEVTVSDKLPDEVAKIMKSQRESELIINKYFNNPNYILGDAMSESDVEEMTEEELHGFDLDSLLGD